MNFGDQFRAFALSAGQNCRLRFAPTPSGFLHSGNALNFALNWLVARLNGGKILLRIDDLDAERKRPEYVADIFESLEWLGLDWDEGPRLTTYDLRHATDDRRPASGDPHSGSDTFSKSVAYQVADFEKRWSQHLRLPLYFKVLDKLRASGRLFACRKSRRDLAPFGGDYPPEFRDQNLSLDDPGVAWRIATPPGFPLPDFIVRRRDGIPAYQVASLVDDLHFGITHIIRGADLEASTAAQRFLAAVLSENDFLKIGFLHHPLLTDKQGEKLSKSAGANSLKAMREGGAGPESVFLRTSEMLGLREARSASGLLEYVQH